MEIHIQDMIYAIINFLVLVAILNKFLYKPILGMLDVRKQEIVNKYDQAEKARGEALAMKDEYAREMQNVKREAQEIIVKASKLAEDTGASLISEAREESAKLMKKAQAEIRLEKEKAKAELRDEVASLAVMAAGKVLDKTMKVEDHQKLIHDFVNEVGDVS